MDNAYQRLEKELAKTACLSEDYKRHILGEAQNVAAEAYDRGIKRGRELQEQGA